MVRPLLRLIQLIAIPVRSTLEMFLGATVAPLCASVSTCFSQIRIKHERVVDSKGGPPFPFIA